MGEAAAGLAAERATRRARHARIGGRMRSAGGAQPADEG
ncbi:hypothetical protein C7S16_2915 [Burkholderia thailandensis]|uniref:Uncharacterized protein n=1 Tax=Burkholderia thailandensis TaxID=57975 RepID=A0AAW9CY80_BURTH|nr:hypothetical protein [Burkholderia thailandensis]MDW9255585.1 hypothetical protein [Burkholderia thailandensis]